MLKKIIENFKQNWISYGFETFTIIIGILGAFALNNWNENRKQKISDYEFLENLKIEIQLDTTLLKDKQSNYIQINDRILYTLVLFENSEQISSTEDSIISLALQNLEVLTPLYKNVSRNDLVLAEGILNRIDSELNQKYALYLENTHHSNNILSKLGESLQAISIQDVGPFIVYNYLDGSNKKVEFDFKVVKTNNRIKNALNKSLYYRRVSLSQIENQHNDAIDLLDAINMQLYEKQ